MNRVILSNLLLIFIYFSFGNSLSVLSLPHIDNILMWLPASIAVSAVLLWGFSLLPAAFFGEFLLAMSLHGWSDAASVNIATIMGVESLLFAFSARYLLVRFSRWPSRLNQDKQIITFFLLAAVIASLISSGGVAIGVALTGDSILADSVTPFTITWLAKVIGVVMVCPIMFSFFAYPRKLWRTRIISVSLPLVVLFGVLLLMLTLAQDRDRALNDARFDSSTRLVNALIENKLNYHRSLLRSMQAYFGNSEEVTESEFQHFLADYKQQHTDVKALAWLEYIRPGQLNQFQRDTGLHIKNHDSNSSKSNDTSFNQSALVVRYLTVEQSEAETPYSDLLGVNLCAFEERLLCQQENLSSENIFTVKNLLPNLNNGPDSFFYLLPVIDKREQVMGYVLQMINVQALFSDLYQSQVHAWVDFAVTRQSTGERLFNTVERETVDDVANNIFKKAHVINYSGDKWLVEYTPSPFFMSHYSNRYMYGVMIVTLLCFSLISIWLLTITGRYNRVENEVARKTRELQQRSELLAKSEKKYRHLVENLQDEYFLYSHDVNGIFDYVGPSVTLILGYSQEEFLQHYMTFVPETEVNQLVPLFTEHTLAGYKSNYEIEILDKKGGLHTLAVTEVPSYNDNKEVIGVEGIARDITEFKASQQKLEKLSLAVEHSPNAILVMDQAGEIEYVNPKFTSITGYHNDDKLGRWPDLINSGVNMPGIYDEIWNTIRHGDDWRGELQYRKKNGDLYWAQELIAPMLNSEGHATHFVATQIDITEARRLSEETSYQATHDQLTGLINRHEFDLRLERVVLAAKHNLTEHALCFLDLDQFKLVNDTCGHIAGDELLRQIGSLLQNNVRSRDTIARLGGDEFAVLMEHCSIDRAYKACEQILQLLQDFRFHWQDYTFTVGGSIGLTIIDQHTRDSNEALKHVDTACYSAKDAGRNRVEVHREDSLRLQQRRGEIHWSTEISEALDDDRFLLYAQPIKSVMNPERGMSYEVLVRMLRKDGEISPPGAFLPAAERYNSINRIDRWVVSHTFDWLNKNAAKLNKVATVSINLSGLSMGDESMLTFIIEQLETAKIPAEKIKFEITETAAIANLRAATKFIETLRESGIHFSLDDFGSGLSSFAYLKKLKVDTLKIDGMFVKDMLTDPLDFEMVKSINEIGHVMGLETIAEFVESEAILAKLSEIGVDFVQGYAIGKPAPIDDILNSLS